MICLCFTNAPFVLRIHLNISPSQRSQDRLSSGAPLDSSLLPDFPLLLLLQSAPFVICSLKYILWSLPSIIKLLLSCYQHYGRWAFLGHCPLKSNCVGKPGRLRSAHSAAGINSCPAEDWLCFWFSYFGLFLFRGSVCCWQGIVSLLTLNLIGCYHLSLRWCRCHRLSHDTGLFLLLVLLLAADHKAPIPWSSHWSPGRAWCCGVRLAVLHESWGVLLASHHSRSDPLLSSSPHLRFLGSLVGVVLLLFRSAAAVAVALGNPYRWCCQLLFVPLNPDRLLFLMTGVMVVLRGRFSYTNSPVQCCGSFYHCKRSNTDLCSQWQHIGGHMPKLVVRGWNILIRLVWWN